MAKPNSDNELGMNREISRRDFLNGVALGTGAGLLEFRSPRKNCWLQPS